MESINEKVGAWLLAPENSREKLADAIGITRPTLNTRLDGSSPWKFVEVIRLAQLLGTTPNDLAGIRSD
jgi:plasmid maintenance system antidote protein VapI